MLRRQATSAAPPFFFCYISLHSKSLLLVFGLLGFANCHIPILLGRETISNRARCGLVRGMCLDQEWFA